MATNSAKHNRLLPCEPESVSLLGRIALFRRTSRKGPGHREIPVRGPDGLGPTCLEVEPIRAGILMARNEAKAHPKLRSPRKSGRPRSDSSPDRHSWAARAHEGAADRTHPDRQGEG